MFFPVIYYILFISHFEMNVLSWRAVTETGQHCAFRMNGCTSCKLLPLTAVTVCITPHPLEWMMSPTNENKRLHSSRMDNMLLKLHPSLKGLLKNICYLHTCRMPLEQTRFLNNRIVTFIIWKKSLNGKNVEPISISFTKFLYGLSPTSF